VLDSWSEKVFSWAERAGDCQPRGGGSKTETETRPIGREYCSAPNVPFAVVKPIYLAPFQTAIWQLQPKQQQKLKRRHKFKAMKTQGVVYIYCIYTRGLRIVYVPEIISPG